MNQIAPGLSSISSNDITEIGDVAARSAFLVDGDAAGREIVWKLTAGGIAESRFLSLPTDITPEDLVDQEIYLETVIRLTVESGQAVDTDRPGLHPTGVARQLAKWLESKGLRPPGKLGVATHLVLDTERLNLSEKSVTILQELHARFCEQLGLQPHAE